MPQSGCSALNGLNPHLKKRSVKVTLRSLSFNLKNIQHNLVDLLLTLNKELSTELLMTKSTFYFALGGSITRF